VGSDTELKLLKLGCIKDALRRLDEAITQTQKHEALKNYNQAIEEFRLLRQATPAYSSASLAPSIGEPL
jgi:hypothetical protein